MFSRDSRATWIGFCGTIKDPGSRHLENLGNMSTLPLGPRFGIPLILRGPLMSLVVTCATDYPAVQVCVVAIKDYRGG